MSRARWGSTASPPAYAPAPAPIITPNTPTKKGGGREAVRRAMRDGAPGAPVVLADTQDNPGVGGNSDTTGLLEALVRQGARGAVLGLMVDPAAAARAHAVGEGHAAEFSLGSLSGLPGHAPFQSRFLVERLGDGRLHSTPAHTPAPTAQAPTTHACAD